MQFFWRVSMCKCRYVHLATTAASNNVYIHRFLIGTRWSPSTGWASLILQPWCKSHWFAAFCFVFFFSQKSYLGYILLIAKLYESIPRELRSCVGNWDRENYPCGRMQARTILNGSKGCSHRELRPAQSVAIAIQTQLDMITDENTTHRSLSEI